MKDNKQPSGENSIQSLEKVKRIRISIFKMIEFEAVHYSSFELISLLLFIIILVIVINSGINFGLIKDFILNVKDNFY